MTAISATAVQALNRRYLLDYPHEAALRIETMSSEEAAALLAEQPLHVVLAVWRYLVDDVAVLGVGPGLLGMALPPGFPSSPWIYVLYARDAPRRRTKRETRAHPRRNPKTKPTPMAASAHWRFTTTIGATSEK